MMYLILAMLSSASIAWIFKISEGRQLKRTQVTTFNYAVAASVSYALYWAAGGRPTASLSPAMLGLGLVAGLFFFLSFILYQISVRQNGAALSGMFGKLGILVPVVVSAVWWRELPTPIQLIGILVAIAAIVWINLDSERKFAWNGLLLGLLLSGGLAEFSNKLFQKYGFPDEKGLFLCVVFLTAMVISLAAAIKDKQPWSLQAAVIGALVGIPNLFSSWFLIMALGLMPATLVFPIYSAGAILFIALGSRLFFKEPLHFKGWMGILLTTLALILMNL